MDGRGTVQVKGKGVLVGRIDRGWLQIVDLTPRDEWSPWVNGVPRGKVVGIRGKNVTFRLSKGRYKIVARGEGISISARGEGTVVLDGEPDSVGDTGRYAVGDAVPQPLPADDAHPVVRRCEGSVVRRVGQDPSVSNTQTILVVEDETVDRLVRLPLPEERRVRGARSPRPAAPR